MRPMWFKKQTKNRRNERESVLEVKMRSRDVRRARLRAVTGLVGAVATLPPMSCRPRRFGA